MSRWFDVDVDLHAALAAASNDGRFSGRTVSCTARWHGRFSLCALAAFSFGSSNVPASTAYVVAVDASTPSLSSARSIQVVAVATAAQSDKLAVVTALEWHPLRRTLAVGLSDGVIQLISWSENTVKRNSSNFPSADLKFSNGIGSKLPPGLAVRDLSRAHSAAICSLAFGLTGKQSPSDVRLLSGDMDGGVTCWKACAKGGFTKLNEYRANGILHSLQYLQSGYGGSSASSAFQFLMSTNTALTLCDENGHTTLIYTLPTSHNMLTSTTTSSLSNTTSTTVCLAHVLQQPVSLSLEQSSTDTNNVAAGNDNSINGYLILIITDAGLVISLQMLKGGRIANTTQIKIGGGVYSSMAEGDSSTLDHSRVGVGFSTEMAKSQWTACWVGDGLVAIGHKLSQVLRLIDLIGAGSDATTLELPDTENGRINTISFDKVRCRIAVGTDSGHMVVWKGRTSFQKDEGRFGRVWELLPRTSLGGSVDVLLFHPFHPILFCVKRSSTTAANLTTSEDQLLSSLSNPSAMCKLVIERTELTAANANFVCLQRNVSLVDVINLNYANSSDDKSNMIELNSSTDISSSNQNNTSNQDDELTITELTQKDNFKRDKLQTVSISVNTSVIITGLMSAGQSVMAVWSDVNIELWKVLGSGSPKMLSSYPYQADVVVVDSENAYFARDNKIDITNHLGIFKFSIWLLDSEGEVVRLCTSPFTDMTQSKDLPSTSNNSSSYITNSHGSFFGAGVDKTDIVPSSLLYLTIITSNNVLCIYETSKQQPKSHVSSKSLDSYVPGLVTIKEVAVNGVASFVAFVMQLGATSRHPDDVRGSDDAQLARVSARKLVVYDVENDRILHWHGNQPVLNVLWDTNDSRFLAVEVESMGKNDTFDDTVPTTELHTFFVTTLHGLVHHGVVTCPDVPFLVSLPYYVFRASRPDGKSVVCKRLAPDFQGMEDCIKDDGFVKAMIDFRMHLSTGNIDEAFKCIRPLKTTNIWRNLCQLCIKTKRLDVALICLGHMHNAVAAKLVRECSDDIEKLGTLAIQLELYDDAVILWKSNERWDLLSRLYQATGKWKEAVDIAEQHDRINVRRVWHGYGKHLECIGDFTGAVTAFEKCGSRSFEVTKMLLQDETELRRYMEGQKSKDARKWWARYLESKGDIEQALQYYDLAEDHFSVARLLCEQDQVQKAVELAVRTSNPAAYYRVAQAYEAQDKSKQAIAYYAKAKCFSHAIRLAKQHGLLDDLMHLALQGSKSMMVDVARYYETTGDYLDKAIRLYHQGGDIGKALELAVEHQQYEVLQSIAGTMESGSDPAMLRRCAEALVADEQITQAVQLLLMAHDFQRGLELCLTHSVTITDDLAEHLTPPAATLNGADDANHPRMEIVLSIADGCMAQGNYQLACKKYTQAGDRVKAIKALLKSGETEKIIYYAGASGAKNREIYIMAANYLQTLDWRNDTSLMKHIITFYTKAKAFDSMAMFFDVCAQVEIDEYQNYEKKVKGSGPEHEKRLFDLQRRIELLSVFVKARKLVRGSAGSLVNSTGYEEALRLCAQLLGEPDVNNCVRTGDIYSFLIETFYHGNQLVQAVEIYKKMLQTVPLKLIDYYLDAQVLAAIDPDFEQRKRASTSGAGINASSNGLQSTEGVKGGHREEEDMDHVHEEYEGEEQRA